MANSVASIFYNYDEGWRLYTSRLLYTLWKGIENWNFHACCTNASQTYHEGPHALCEDTNETSNVNVSPSYKSSNTREREREILIRCSYVYCTINTYQFPPIWLIGNVTRIIYLDFVSWFNHTVTNLSLMMRTYFVSHQAYIYNCWCLIIWNQWCECWGLAYISINQVVTAWKRNTQNTTSLSLYVYWLIGNVTLISMSFL